MEFLLGIVLGLLGGLLIYNAVAEKWLSPKEINGQLYYYGRDHKAPQNEECYYWEIVGKYRRTEISTFTQINE